MMPRQKSTNGAQSQHPRSVATESLPHMNRRRFFQQTLVGTLSTLVIWGPSGCRSRQTAQVMKPGETDMVGSHGAGAETYKPLVDEAVAKLLAGCDAPVMQQVGYEQLPPPQ